MGAPCPEDASDYDALYYYNSLQQDSYPIYA